MPTTAPQPTGPALADVAKYMAATGWAHEHIGTFAVYYPPSNDDLQVVLPDTPDNNRNLNEQISAAVRVIAYIEGRTTQETAANIAGSGADTIAVRLLPETPIGTAPLDAAQEAISALRDLVVGAATALRTDALVLPTRRAAEADDYANRTRFSTRPGSFIVDLALPMAQPTTTGPSELDPPEQGTFFEREDIQSSPRPDPHPYGRAISRRIRQTVTRALDAAEQVNIGDLALTAFTEQERHLGNATELAAISKLGGELGTPFQIRFTDTRLTNGAQPVDVITATPAQQRTLADAAALIREKQTFDEITLTGYVIRLVKKRPSNHGPGLVTVRAVVNELDETINCWVNLTAADYEQALAAHSNGNEVNVTGTLEFAHNRWHLRDAHQFQAVTGE